jgi:LacI family transcriptional regulator
MPVSTQPVTLRDVAAATRLHYSTVSLALRGDPRIAAVTRGLVSREAALVRRRRGEELRSPTIAYVVNHGVDAVRGLEQFRAAVLAGARAQATLLGFRLKIYRISDDGRDSDLLEKHLQRDQIECVVLSMFPPGCSAPHLDWDRYSLIRIDSQHLVPALHTVSTDRIHNVRRAFRALWDQGARRIGLCVGRLQEDCTRQRHAMGYMMEEACLSPAERIPPLLHPYGSGRTEQAKLLAYWLRRYRPEAVLHDVPVVLPAGTNRRRVIWVNLARHEGRGMGINPMPEIVGQKAVAAVAMLLRTGEKGIPRFAVDTYVEGRWIHEQ